MKRAIKSVSNGAKKIKIFSGENKEMVKSLAGLSERQLLDEVFNQGKKVKWKFAYRIKHLYKLNEPIGMRK